MAQFALAEGEPQRVKPINPLETAAQVLGIRQAQQGIRANDLKLKEAAQEQEDEQAIRQAAQKRQGDPDGILEELNVSNPRAAQKWATALSSRRKTETETLKANLDNAERKLQLTAQVAQGIKDEPTFHVARTQLESILGPDASQALGDTYDPAKVQQLLDGSLKHTEWLKAQQDATENARKAQEAETAKGRESREARESWEKSIASALSASESQQDFDNVTASLTHLGAPKDLFAVYGTEWTPKVQEKANAVLGRHPEKKSFEEQTYDDYLKSPESQKYGPSRIGFDKYKQAQRVEAQKAGRAPEEGTSITDQSLDMLATQFAKTGNLPALGMGSAAAGDRRRIFNRASELFPTIDVASNKADFDANRQSLTALTKNRDAVVAFENTASKNLSQFLTTAQKVVDSGSPWINTPLRQVGQQGLGSNDLAAFNAARQVAINEIAKVISNPNLTGQLSDSARKEVEAFIPASATLKQVFDVANILKSDMKNRHDSLDEQIGEIQKRISGKGATSAPAAGSRPPLSSFERK